MAITSCNTTSIYSSYILISIFLPVSDLVMSHVWYAPNKSAAAHTIKTIPAVGLTQQEFSSHCLTPDQ